MASKHKTIILLPLMMWLLPLTASAQPCYPNGEALYNRYPNSLLYVYGITGTDSVPELVEGQFHRWPEHIQSLEFNHVLSMENRIRQFFYPIVGVVYLAGNVTVRQGGGEHKIYEFVPYIGFRWVNWSWNDFINTSFALGEGMSYTTSVPSVENHGNPNTKRLLNYMLVEATFALPKYPRMILVARLHHRSGAFGLYGANNTGSNTLCLGIKYLFD